jgi:hypothetical protein
MRPRREFGAAKTKMADYAIANHALRVEGGWHHARENIRIYSRTRVDGAVTAPGWVRILGRRASRGGCEVRLLL